MKLKSFFQFRPIWLLLPVLALSGCALFSSPDKKISVYDPPRIDTSMTDTNVPHLHIGDVVSVTFTGLEQNPDPLDKPIKEDGTITLPDVGRVTAAGKTVGELEDAIHDLYVPGFYKHLNVTVKTSSDRAFYVSGEVHAPGRLLYTGPISLSKAITSAGDFTDFASRSDVILIRANGDRFEVNVNKILAGKIKDPQVYPGDQITVQRRTW
jgi:polysaccharide export outer membrane protein